MEPTPNSLSQDRLPDWLAEALDVLSARRRLVVGVAIGLVLLGGIVSLVAPSILPARPVVGVAVGIAAALLATALALALDASDLVVRGARHVRAAGGRVDVRVARGHDDVGPLLAAVARHATEGVVRVALTPASRSAAVPGPRATALAESIARTGRRVLLTDLTRGGSPASGLSDVVNGDRSLSEVVRFEQELFLARLAVGSDPDAAVRGFGSFVQALPSDLEVLVVALPPLAEPGVLKAAETLDLTLVLVEVDRTERVDLIASLDAMDAANVTSELVLIDPTSVSATATDPQAEHAEAEATGTGDDVEAADDVEATDVTEAPVGEQETASLSADDGAIGSVTRGASLEADALVDPDERMSQPPAADYSFSPPQQSEASVSYDEALEAPDEPEPGEADWIDEDETAAALASLLEREDLDDTPVANTEFVDVDEATTDQADQTDEITVAHDPPAPTEGADDTPDHTPDAAPDDDSDEAPDEADGVGAVIDVTTGDEAATNGQQRAPAWVTSGAAPATSHAAEDLEGEAAFEVARTSAALQQLAQQVWQRQAR